MYVSKLVLPYPGPTNQLNKDPANQINTDPVLTIENNANPVGCYNYVTTPL